jgi:RHS repeat-associated protein
VVERISYSAYGESTGSSLTRYTYTGREEDEVTGLIYYRARWYDPSMGRFISEDPIEFQGGDINWYAYVHNNPLNYYDPSGMQIRAAERTRPEDYETAKRQREQMSKWPNPPSSNKPDDSWYGKPGPDALKDIGWGVLNLAKKIWDAWPMPKVPEESSSRCGYPKKDDEDKKLYGPFHRRQTSSMNQLMVSSGLIGGKTPRGGFKPAVQAWNGPLPDDFTGLEFYTTIKPSSATPAWSYWHEGHPGVIIINDDTVGIPFILSKRVDNLESK